MAVEDGLYAEIEQGVTTLVIMIMSGWEIEEVRTVEMHSTDACRRIVERIRRDETGYTAYCENDCG